MKVIYFIYEHIPRMNAVTVDKLMSFCCINDENKDAKMMNVPMILTQCCLMVNTAVTMT